MSSAKDRIATRRRAAFLLAACAVACVLSPRPAAAEAVKIGLIKLASDGAVYLAMENGYFAAEGLTPELVYFEAANAIAVAGVSGDVDFGVSAPSVPLYTLGGQGALKIIAGNTLEAPGYHYWALVASNRAEAAGLKSYSDLGGHSVAITQIGGPNHYVLSLLEEKFRIAPSSVKIAALQALPNLVSAVTGGQTDFGIAVATVVVPGIDRGDMKLVGWTGEVVPWQSGVVYTATKTIEQKPGLVERFLRAFHKGAKDYHDAFSGPDDRPQDGPTAAKTVAVLAKYVGQTEPQVRLGLPLIDAEARLDVKDILHQIDWYKSQGMVKPEVDGNAIIDQRYVVPLPQR